MDSFVVGVALYAALVIALSVGIAITALRARSQGATAPEILRRLLPYIVAQTVLTVVFVAWAIVQL